jgi:malate dehydrogenase (oxaloacetate-decarboxylating)
MGAAIVKAASMPDEVFSAGARAVHEFTGVTTAPGASIFPPLSKLRAVSRAVAINAAQALVAANAAPPMERAEIERRVDAAAWEPNYLPYRAG